MPVESGSSSIELIVGPYRTGKTRDLLEQLIVQARSSAFAKLLVVVPSARYRALLEDRLYEIPGSRGTGPGVFGLRVVPFYRLCRSVLESAGHAVKVVPDSVRPALVGQVVDELLAEGDLRSLAAIARLPGTSAAVLQLIDEFQRAGFSPHEVRVKLEETAAAESRYLELARIYDRYWATLDSIGYFDRRRLAFAAREILYQEDAADGQGALPQAAGKLDLLAVDGFDRISRLQAQVMLGLSRQARKTTVVFDYPCEAQVNELLDEYLWKRSSFEELLKTLNPLLRPQQEGGPACGSGEQRASPVRISTALDRFLEMQEIARSCKSAMVRQGKPGSELLVVARDLKAYRGAIEAAFDEAAVPYFVDESVDLRGLPLVQVVLMLLRLAIEDFPRADVLALLRSPYFNLTAVGLRMSDVDDIDRWTWDAAVVSGREKWSAAVRHPRVRSALVRLFDRATPAAPLGTLMGYLSWTEDLLDGLVRLPSGARSASEPAGEDVEIMSSLRGIVRSLVLEDSIIPSRMISFEAFVNRFETLVDAGNYRRRSQWRDCVTICGADLAPNRMYDEVFVAGMVEGEFPRRSGQSGFVGREELSRWSGFGIDIINPRDHPGFEAALFASLIGRARKRVHLSYPLYEMDGEEVVPSFFIAEQLASRPPDGAAPFAASRIDPVSPRDAFLGRLWQDPRADTQEILSGHPAVESLQALLGAPVAMARGRICGNRDSVYNGWLVDLVGTGTLSVELPEQWSASRLNYYGQCPFKYWVSKSLGIAPRPEPQTGVGRDRLGTAYHRALELFYKRVVEAGQRVSSMDQDLLDGMLATAADEALSGLETDQSITVGDFWDYEKREFHFRLRRFLSEEIKREQSDEDGFRPSQFEVLFGEANPPLVIDTAGGAIALRGSIDRIDFAGDELATHVRVVDYKTGSSYIKASDAESGRSLQLPIYALAAERVILPGSRVTRGVYLSINSGETVGRLDFVSAQELRKSTEELVAGMVQSISRGDFAVRPTDAGLCESCDHRKVCRVAEINQEDLPDEQTD